MPSEAPGLVVISATSPPPRGIPTTTGVGFATGITERGSAVTWTTIRSMNDFLLKLGPRTTKSQVAYDAAEAALREGLNTLYFSRVLGTGFKSATLKLEDKTKAESLLVTAISPGEWANGAEGGISVAIIAGVKGGTFRVEVFLNKVLVEKSRDLTTQLDAVEWSQTSNYVVITKGASAEPPEVVAETNLAGGDDKHGAINDASWLAAQDRFISDLGPGQIAQWGRTTEEAHNQLLAHAESHNRFAVCDPPDSGELATLKELTLKQRIGERARWGGLWAPYVRIPGPLPGTFRTVPPSAIVMGRIAAVDLATGNPNNAAAGGSGECEYAIGLSQAPWTDTQRGELNGDGVNVIKLINETPVIYGFRTFVDPIKAPEWLNAANQRLYMAIAAKSSAIAAQFVFAQLDGKGSTDSRLETMLIGMLIPYFENGSLFGARQDEAFLVETGPALNTVAVEEKQELLAIINLKMSEDAEKVQIAIVKTALSGSVI